MWVGSLGRKDPLVEEMAIRSSILAWEIPSGLQSMGLKDSDTMEHTGAVPDWWGRGAGGTVRERRGCKWSGRCRLTGFQ